METSRHELLKLASLAATGRKRRRRPPWPQCPSSGSRTPCASESIPGVGGRGNSPIDNFAEIPQVARRDHTRRLRL